MVQHKPLKLEELKLRRESYTNKLKTIKKGISSIDRLAVWITDKVGSMRFFVIIFVWTTVWLGWNIFGPKAMRFDPYPAFVLWLFMSNMIQLFLMPLIMIGQNLQSHHQDVRAEADLNINVLAALENETILIHLENQNEIIMQILKHIESNMSSSKK